MSLRSLRKMSKKRRLMTGKERPPPGMLHLNSSDSNFDSRSRGTAHQSKYKKNIVTDTSDHQEDYSKIKKKGKKGGGGKKKKHGEIPLKRGKISRDQQLLGGGASNKNLHMRSNEDLMDEVASDNEGVGFQITINHAKGLFSQNPAAAACKRKHHAKKKAKVPQPTLPPPSRSGEREVAQNGFTVYGGIRKSGVSPSVQSLRTGGFSKNRLVVKDGQVIKESRVRSKPRVPAFVRPAPQKMLKSDPQFLAQSPELADQVELQQEVNILEPGQLQQQQTLDHDE